MSLYGPRKLSQRQWEVIRLVSEGMKNHEVAEAIGTTANVVRNMLKEIFNRLGLWNRVELALWFVARTEGVK